MNLRLGEKGWAAYAGADLAAGQFVCLYVGDQLTNRAADTRLAAYDIIPGGANHALLASLPENPKLFVGGWVLAKGAMRTYRIYVYIHVSIPHTYIDQGNFRMPNLQVIREHLYTGSCLRLNIDATRRGNVARFFNHACDGGVLSIEVSRQRSPHLVTHIAYGQNCTQRESVMACADWSSDTCTLSGFCKP